VKGTLFFAANDGNHGMELWKSDGSAAGTVLVKDVNPGSLDSDPGSLTVAGGHLFFPADDGVHGFELWDPPIVPASGTGTVSTHGRMSSRGDALPLSAQGAAGDVGVAILPAPGAPFSRSEREDIRPLAGHPTGLIQARAADTGLTQLLDVVLAALPDHAKKARLGRAPVALWDPDPLEDFASSWWLGWGLARAWSLERRGGCGTGVRRLAPAGSTPAPGRCGFASWRTRRLRWTGDCTLSRSAPEG
jgi:ELWxxDGT repeat protein